MGSQGNFHTPPISAQGSHDVTESENEFFSESESSVDSVRTESSMLKPSMINIGVLVMGLTGAGKSSFILDLIHEAEADGRISPSQQVHEVQIGHSLKSCTNTVDRHLILRTDRYKIWAIDTPGFDDTSQANGKILRDIATFLCKSYHRKTLHIAGLIYVHRISDPRMSKSSVRSIRICEALCGASNFGAVRVVTTMWDALTTDSAREAAIEREHSLQSRDEFFGFLAKGEAKFHKHARRDANSLKVIESLWYCGQPVKLAVVRELREGQGTTLLDTSAGKYLRENHKEKRAEYEAKLNRLEEYRRMLDRGTEKIGNKDNRSDNRDEIEHGQDYEDDTNDLRSEIQEIRQHIRLLEENGADTKYLNVTYGQLLEDGRELPNDEISSEEEIQEHVRATLKDLERRQNRPRAEVELRDARQADQSGKQKEQPRSNDDRGEMSRANQERLTKVKKQRGIFSDLLYFYRKGSVPNIQEKDSPQSKNRSGPTPESSPKASRRDAKTKRSKVQERRTVRQEADLNISSEPQHMMALDQVAFTGRVDDETTLYLDQFPYPHYTYTSGQEVESSASYSPRHHSGHDTLFHSPDHSPTFGSLNNSLDYGSVSLPRKYEKERKFRYRSTPVNQDEFPHRQRTQ